MNNFIQTVLSPAKLFDMAGDTQSFKNWLLKTHNMAYDEGILKGHRFFLECAFTSVFHTFIHSDSVALKKDPILELGANGNISIDKMPGKSDRQLILKNLIRDYLDLTTANNETDLQKSINAIKEKIVTSLVEFYNTNFRIRKNIQVEREKLDEVVLMDDLLIYFMQINNSGPYAHQGALIHSYWIPEEKLNESFEGYKYVIQYLYGLILPSDIYLKAQINEIHKADSWRTFVFNEIEGDNDDLILKMFNQTYDLEKQTCFESYFYRINNVLEEELPKRYSISNMNPERNLVPIKKKLPKSIVLNLIDSHVKRFDVEMTLNERLGYNFQWYPVDVSNILNANAFNGVAAFNTLLIGTLEVTKNEPVYVNRWKHITENPKHNDYSYAILLNTYETSSGLAEQGWMLFFDCCNDFTASRSDFLLIEKIIKKNKKRIRFFSEEINHEDFSVYLKNYIPDKHHLIQNEILGIKELSQVKKNKEVISKYQDAKGVLLELLCFYVVSQHHHYQNFKIKRWGIKSGGKEIDVFLESNTQVRLIECKQNGKTMNEDLEKRINEMNEVLSKRIEAKRNDKNGLEILHHKIDGAIEFWFWHPPSIKNIELLKNRGIKFEVFEWDQKKSEYENHIKYSKMKNIFTLNSFAEDDIKNEI